MSSQFLSLLPTGRTLPLDEWDRRHAGIVWLVWANVIGLPIFGVAQGHELAHALGHGLALTPFAALATAAALSRRLRAAIAALGLLTAAALLVHSSGGVIEMHFYFFVTIVVLTLYEDWLLMLVALVFVLLHHGVLGTLQPHSVYNGAAQVAEPWKWAAIHALFVLAAGAAAVTAWRLNESVRRELRATQKELHRLAVSDVVTGLPNRRAWDERLEEEVARAARGDYSLSVALIDLDDFKLFNDTNGHQAGDRLLKACAGAWRTNLRDLDLLARIGGDEFGVILPGCDASRAGEVLARERLPAPEGTTWSTGIASWMPGDDADCLIGRADTALYVDKRRAGVRG